MSPNDVIIEVVLKLFIILMVTISALSFLDLLLSIAFLVKG